MKIGYALDLKSSKFGFSIALAKDSAAFPKYLSVSAFWQEFSQLNMSLSVKLTLISPLTETDTFPQ